MKSLKFYFESAIQAGASDLHLVGGEKPLIRIKTSLKPLEDTPLSDTTLRSAIQEVLSKEQKERFGSTHELDMGYAVGDHRFRINLHEEMGNIGLSARLIPGTIPTPEELGFTEKMKELSRLMDGLIIVTGPTGSGKSTTLATMVEGINQNRKAHIVTIEDPIEFLFKDKESLIEQREVGVDTLSFHEALKRVLRQDPNVILVGEMRDQETIRAALTAAETGHLVFSTLHTPSAAEAVERIVDVFEGEKQKQVLIQLSSVLRAVISQQLLPTVKGDIVAAREILINTAAVANLIRENNIAQIKSAIQTGAKDGMVTMENAVKELLEKGVISEEVAEKRGGTGKRRIV